MPTVAPLRSRAPLLLLAGAWLAGPWLAACGRGGRAPVTLDEVAAYEAVVRGELSGAAAVEACRGIRAEDTRGDCVVTLAQRSAREPDAGASLCPDAPPGTWRDECWFVVAEGQRRAGNREAAAAACLQAGGFADDCGQHLWQSEVRAAVLGRPGGGPPDRGASFGAVAPRLREIHGAWAPLLAAGTDLDTRLYERAFANGFEAAGFVDLGRCADLAPDLQARCQAAGATIVALRARAELPGSIRALCGADPADPGLWQRLRAADHPALREALAGLEAEAGCSEDAPSGARR